MNGARLRQIAKNPLLLLGGFFVLMIFTGCVKYTEGYHSMNLSNDIPFCINTARNPVIVIHGLFGAELIAPDGEKVWGKFSNQRITDKKILAQLASPDLRPGSILTHSEITPGNVTIYRFKNYALLLNALRKFGYTEKNLFTFAYDWRKSVPENAAELHNFILEKEKLFPSGQKFDIIAHSMGGLISRYYLRYGNAPLPHEGTPPLSDTGAEKIAKVFIFGTPNCGYTDTLIELVNGLAFVRPAAKYPAHLLINFKSYFCMLPHSNLKTYIYSDDGTPVNIYDIETWKKLKWLCDESPTTISTLAKNLRMAEQFALAMQKPVPKKQGIKLYLFAGNSFSTARQCSVDRKSGKITVTKYAQGDGKILFESAVGNNSIQWDGIYIFGAAHMGLFVSNDAMRNLNYLLQKEAVYE